MPVATVLPTLSQVQALDTAYLREAADYWARTTTLWEEVFTEVHDRMVAPGGIPWQGAAAAAAREGSYRDVVAVRGAVDQLQQAAGIARRGDEQLRACKAGVLEAVDEARAGGFDVGEDYSVADRSRGGSAAYRSARLATAQGHASFIRHRVGALLATDHQLTAEITAATSGVDDLTFPQEPVIDDTVVGDDEHDGIQLVDNHTWKHAPPQPIPPDPAPGPLPPINNAEDVRRVLDPLQNGGKRGPNGMGTKPKVKELWDAATIKRMWDYLTRNAADCPGPPDYDGPVRVLPDGTKIGLRQSGKGWGDTLDVWYPNGTDRKIHTPYAPPLISPPPQLPPPGHPAPLPVPPPQVGHPPVVLSPTQVVDPARLPPWLQNPSPPGFQVNPGAPLPIAPLDLPDAPAVPGPSPAPPAPGGPLLPDLAHDLAEAGKAAGAGVLAGIAIIGGLIAGGLTPGGQIAR
ncbi:hypothetical protein [Mycobacterium canetti]|uniref:hypothetical protein n=1 Tax=Mycobacterium canetti TaxID=78331 RepID=UPI0002A5A3B6|nr:hypothetical protein [Mycobacterium canetti]CCK58288.1 Conserved protein of unknown function [Mycobacterium canettii CIPT 140070010]